jgi:uncharacterized peroxidase-related enzyme
MRLHEAERGDTLTYRMLIPVLSFVSGMRLPDAARAVFYHKSFFGDPMSFWTHAGMRGENFWSAGERELIAAMTATWNSCSFCIGAHGAIAARALGRSLVDASLQAFTQAQLSAEMQAVLPFLEKLTRTPNQLTVEDAQAVMQKGISSQAFEDALAVCVLFNITTRCADALGYEMLDDASFAKAAKRLLAQGYAFGKGKKPAHPDHRAMAEAVRHAVLKEPGVTDSTLRQAMARRGAGEKALLDEPYDSLAKQIGVAAYQVTDEQVAAVVKHSGSEKAAYELMVAASVGAGFYRWDKALHVFDQAKSEK